MLPIFLNKSNGILWNELALNLHETCVLIQPLYPRWINVDVTNHRPCKQPSLNDTWPRICDGHVLHAKGEDTDNIYLLKNFYSVIWLRKEHQKSQNILCYLYLVGMNQPQPYRDRIFPKPRTWPPWILNVLSTRTTYQSVIYKACWRIQTHR